MDRKPIDLTKSVNELTTEYPALIDILKELGFATITNPITRRTMGRKITLPKGCEMKKIPLEKVKARLEEEGFQVIDNKQRERRETLKQIILGLHQGEDPEILKKQFKELLQDVDATEISQLEQELISEGLMPEEIKKLCDVHAAVFRESLDKQKHPQMDPGHPVQIFKKENRAFEAVNGRIRAVLNRLQQLLPSDQADLWREWQELHQQLRQVEKHYSRKENILFPYLEKHGITGPSSVMWGIHDDIRAEIKKVTEFLDRSPVFDQSLVLFINETVLPLLTTVEEMIYKEENILFPMCLDTVAESEWGEIYQQSDEIGFALIEPDHGWQPDQTKEPSRGEAVAGALPGGLLKLDTGVLTIKEISLIFNNLPVDITFVDDQDTVRYYSHGPERIFERTPAIIGRKVQNCHPPDSVHMVTKILDQFKNREQDKAEFWLNYKDMYVYITYYAVRDKDNNYLGTLEITQNIKPLQQITGEKRILDDW